MKILQKKGFVIVLAVFALALVGRNLFWPLIKRSFPARTAASAPTAAPAAAPAATPAPASGQPQAGVSPVNSSRLQESDRAVSTPGKAPAPMNAIEVSSSASQWVKNPRRDPFKVSGARSDGKAARDLLVLGGVLRQTESTLVVLNNRVMAVGDAILGFKLETVEDHCVWVTGPNGREQVEFKYTLPPSPAKELKDLSLAQPSENSTRK